MKIFAADMKEENKKTYKTVAYKLIPLQGNNSDTGWDMLNIVGYKVLMTYYYMSFFHITWMEIYVSLVM